MIKMLKENVEKQHW